MPRYSQSDRPIAVTTPLGEDVLLLAGIRGHEAISQLFSFQLEMLAERESEIHFDRLLGQSVTVELQLPSGEKRYFNGLVNKLRQGASDEIFTSFHAEVVPKFWLLTKKISSRIFQHASVPDILHEVLTGVDTAYRLNGTYYPRDYCVQYGESDFDFASRLMEEEGIYYYFEHTHDAHQMVVTDLSTLHPCVSDPSTVAYETAAGGSQPVRVKSWEKTQELRSGEYSVWDHCFELPGNHLEAKEKIIESVAVGKVIHKLRVGGNDALEIYDYPGGYAQRFDGVSGSGGAQPEDLAHILADRDRTVRIRMEREETASLELTGESDCGHFAPGHKFTLERHFDGDGDYLLTRIEHDAHIEGAYSTGLARPFFYENRFACIPAALAYRPPRVTHKPVIPGVQTATVAGPHGEEMFCDKYGRVKVQFHWDREGKSGADSSCWLRVAQVWAGKGWGAFFWPRIGHEVVVAFEEGDPDQPLIIGSVYNAGNLPPMALPRCNMFAGIKSASVDGSPRENANSLVFVDVKGQEHLALHSERHMILNAEYDVAARVGRHHFQRVPSAHVLTVGRLPVGGGSGGAPTTDTLSGTIWAQPVPQAVAGINASMVYGSAFQSSVPLAFQLASGSMIQMFVDPVGFGEAFSEWQFAAKEDTLLFGSGACGNVQMTLGTSSTIAMGLAYDIHIGPKKITLESSDKPALRAVSLVLGAIMGALALVFQLAYGLSDQDDVRSILVMSFEGAIQALLAGLMGYDNLYHSVEVSAAFAYKAAHGEWKDPETFRADFSIAENIEAVIESLMATIAMQPAVIAPPILGSIGESKLRHLAGENSW